MQLIAKLLNLSQPHLSSAIALLWKRLNSVPAHDKLKTQLAKGSGRSRHFCSSKSYLLLFSGAGLLGMTIAESVVAQPAPPLAATVTLSPKFSPDPLELRGIAGGSVVAKDVAERSTTQTGPCNGFVDAEPDHTVVLSAFFGYLSLKGQSPQDTTLVIKGPGGIWCNDDHEGKDPGVAGEWLAGTYQIWVGSYDKTNYVPYILKITETR